MLPSDRMRAGLRLGAMMLAAGVLAVVPTEFFTGIPSVCLFRNLLGVECLGCGMVRAASCLLHGQVGEAAAFNQLIVAAIPVAGLAAFRDIRVILKNCKR